MVLTTDTELKPVQFENIPQDMKDIPAWVLWKAETKSSGKRDKIPYRVNGNNRASSTEPKSWGTFEEVKAKYESGGFDGVGIVLNDSHRLYTLDIDGTINHEYLEALKDRTYCEYSPSGNGVHVYLQADKPKEFKKRGNKNGTELELYAGGRFMTVTGDICSTANTVEDNDEAINMLIKEVFTPEGSHSDSEPHIKGLGESILSVNEVTMKAINDSRRGEDIKLILNGEWEQAKDGRGKHFPSQSESDQSLMNTLAFYSKGDKRVMYEIWENSGAYRKEKDHKSGGIGKTMDTAVNGLKNVYDPDYNNTEFDFAKGYVTHDDLVGILQERRKQELERMEQEHEENGGRGRKPNVIQPLRCAEIVMTVIEFALFDTKENTKLAMYDHDEGIYSRNKNKMYRLIDLLEPHHNEQKMNDVIFHISKKAPVREKTETRLLIPVKNGVFNTLTKRLESFTPEYVFTTKIDTKYVENPEKPIIDGWDIDTWLSEIACGDDEIVHLLWQAINESLNGNYTRKKAIFLVGEGNNGKGTFQSMIINLLGLENIASLKVNEFDKPFRMAGLEGKTSVIGDELPSKIYIDDSSNFNSVVTGDIVTVEQKNQPAYESMFKCTVIQSTNDMPRFRNKTQGTLRRIVIVPFNADFEGSKEKFEIKEDYLKRPEVLEYVLNRALQMDFERFDIPKASVDMLEEFKSDNDPIHEFKKTVFDEWDIYRIPKYVVFTYYKEFCNHSGYKAVGKNTFMKDFGRYFGREWQSIKGKVNWEAEQKRNPDVFKYLPQPTVHDDPMEEPEEGRNYALFENTAFGQDKGGDK